MTKEVATNRPSLPILADANVDDTTADNVERTDDDGNDGVSSSSKEEDEEEELSANAATSPPTVAAQETTANMNLQILQQRAAGVLMNFRAGLALQQEQQKQSKLVREEKKMQHQRQEKKQKSPEEEKQQRKAMGGDIVQTEAMSTSEATTPLSVRPQPFKDSSFGSAATSAGSEETATKIHQARSPTGVLDLPTLKTPKSGATSGDTGAKQEVVVVDDLPSPTNSTTTTTTTFSSSFIGKSILSGLTSPTVEDQDDEHTDAAHEFVRHTYNKPTKCDICDGLLVGLWHQGLRCKHCGLNVHCGEGINDHTNCRAEALLQEGGCHRHLTTCCSQEQRNMSDEARTVTSPTSADSRIDPVLSLTEAMQQVRQMARDRPTFLQDVKAQMDRDIKSRVKSIIVSKGAEEQKSKAILKFRTETVLPTLKLLDKIESGGWNLPYALLFAFHILLAMSVSIFAWAGVSVALYRRHSSTRPASSMQEASNDMSLSWSHNVAILYAFHTALALVVLLIRRLINTLHRKSRILDQFLLEVFSLSSEEDLGFSMQQLAVRLRLWIRRITKTTAVMLLASLALYRFSHLATNVGGEIIAEEIILVTEL